MTAALPNIASARSKGLANTAFRKATRRALRFWFTPRRGSNAAIRTFSAPPSSTASRWVFISRRSSCATRAHTASRSAKPTSISAPGIARWNRQLPRSQRGAMSAGHAVRLGFRLIAGLAEDELQKLIAARGNGFSSIERLAAIAGDFALHHRAAGGGGCVPLAGPRPPRGFMGGAPARHDRHPPAARRRRSAR